MQVVFTLLIVLGSVAGEFIRANGFSDAVERAKKEPYMVATLMVVTTAVDCEKCENALAIYEQFSEEIGGMFKTYLLDCKDVDREEKQILPHCDSDKFEMLPALTFLTPNRNESISDPEIQIFKGELSLRSLMESIEQFAPINSLVLQDLEYFDSIFLKDLTYATKVILLKPDRKVPIWWRALTAHFKNRLDFGEIDMEDSFLPGKRYKLPSKFPGLLILRYNQDEKKYRQVEFTGQLEFKSMRDFLAASAEKNEVKKFRSVYEQDSSTWNKVEEISFRQIRRVLELDSMWALVDVSVNSASHASLAPLQAKLRGISKFFKIECAEEECQQWMETEYKMKQFPGVLVFSFTKKEVIKPIVVRSKDKVESVLESMFEGLNSQVQAFQEDFQPETRQIFDMLERVIQGGFLPVVWFSKSEDHFSNLVGLSASRMPRYQQHLKFFFQVDPDQVKTNEWNITTLPYVVAFAEVNLDTGRHKSFFYDKTKFETDKFFTYLNTLSLENEKTQLREVPEAGSQEEFEQLCVLPQKLCIIALLDTMKEGKLKQDSETLSSARAQFREKDVSWLWIDARCHSSLLRMLGLSLDSLSYLILYDTSKAKFLKMEEEFNIKKAIAFLDFGLEKKAKKKFKALPDLFELEYRDCQKHRDSLRKQYKEDKQKKQKERKASSKKDL